MNDAPHAVRSDGTYDNAPVFERIAEDIIARGYALLDDAIPAEMSDALARRVTSLKAAEFARAGIGRAQGQTLDDFVRSDEIHWLEPANEAERTWLDWAEQLRIHLNRRLFLGMFSYEAHFAHYEPGAFYKRHIDAFRGESNRILTTVLYLNREWREEDGGEMVLYPEQGEEPIDRVVPGMGRLAVFLSEVFPHEVLPAKRDRYSIAGWFRVNASTAGRADPPR